MQNVSRLNDNLHKLTPKLPKTSDTCELSLQLFDSAFTSEVTFNAEFISTLIKENRERLSMDYIYRDNNTNITL